MDDASSGLGSLAQSARKKELTTARTILIAVGILTIVVNIGLVIGARAIVNGQIEDELEKVRSQGMVVDDAAVEEVRESSIRSIVVANSIAIGLGVVYVVLGLVVYRWPVPVTIAGLVLYLGSTAAYGALDPTTLGRGWIVKILIIAGLFKAVQAAIASEKEKNEAVLEPLTAPPQMA